MNTKCVYCNKHFCIRHTWSARHRLLYYARRPTRAIQKVLTGKLQTRCNYTNSLGHNDRYYCTTGSFLFQQRVYFSVNIWWHLFEYSQRHGRLPNSHTWLCILGLALDQLSRSLDSCYLLFFLNLMTFVFVFFVYDYVAISFLAWSGASIVSAVSRQSNAMCILLQGV